MVGWIREEGRRLHSAGAGLMVRYTPEVVGSELLSQT